MSRRLIVTTMRNEAPFILEWLVYHRLIGFNDFLIYSNDCDDGTDAILDRLQEMGLITHLDNPRDEKKTVQWKALTRAWKSDQLQSADWVLVSDVDEFLNIKVGDGTLDALFAAKPEAEAFVISWRMFGSSGYVSRPSGLVIETFTQAAPEAMIWPWRAVQCKTLFRMTPNIAKLGVHTPRFVAQHPPPPMVDDNGTPVPSVAGTLLIHTNPRYRLAQMNHYALGSVEDFLIKADRGKPNRSDDAIDLGYWAERNLNATIDESITRHAAAVRQGVDDLMADPVLADLMTKALAWRQTLVDTLMKGLDSFYLQAHIRNIGSTLILPMAEQIALVKRLQKIMAEKPQN